MGSKPISHPQPIFIVYNIRVIRNLFIFSTIFLASCSLDWNKISDPNLPYWTTKLSLPLKTTIIDFKEILSDTSINKIPLDADGEPILYSFEESIPIDTIKFNLNVDVVPFNDSVIAQMDTIKLSKINPKNTDPPFKLREIIPRVDLLPDGSQQIEPSLIDIDQIFSFENFDTATFSQGELKITVTNNMVIPLGAPISVLFQDEENNIIPNAEIAWDAPIASTAFGYMDLQGITLPGIINVRIYGEYDGSGGTINLDDDARNSSFYITIESESTLNVISAIAIIPSQDPIDGSGKIQLGTSDNTIKEAIFDTANLDITISNNIDLDGTVELEIPSILNPSGQLEKWLIPLQRKSETIELISLNSYSLVLYKDDLLWQNQNNPDGYPMDSLQNISYNYNIILDSSQTEIEPPDYRKVDASDSVKISFLFHGESKNDSISFSEITGKFDDFESGIGPNFQSPPNLPEELDNFNLLNEYVEMALDIKMEDIGIPIILNMAIKAVNDETQDSILVEDWNISEDGLYIPILDKPAKLINIRPDSIIITGTVNIDTTDIFTFPVVSDVTMEGTFNISIPFVFELSEDSQIEMDPDFVESNDIPTDIDVMTLIVDYANQMDFGANISVISATDSTYFSDTSTVKPDTLIQSLVLKSNLTSRDSVILDKEKMILFKEDMYLKTFVELIGADTIFFLATDSLIIKLSATLDYIINEPKSKAIPND